jgi:cystathionine gamma-synthase
MSSKVPPKKIATRSVRAGLESDPHHGSVVPPIYLSTNFAFESYRQPRKYDYTRSGNPTRDQLAGALADLEGGAGAIVTSTGLAAITLPRCTPRAI